MKIRGKKFLEFAKRSKIMYDRIIQQLNIFWDNNMTVTWCRAFIVLFVAACFFSAVPLAAQEPLLSPRDSSQIIISGKKIAVNYGKPSMRGRKIMGELVPYTRWWRTGANEATAFTTEADLEMNGVLVPKGSYTLYTLPSEKQWKLIINKQTGQWGTTYNPELDLARINMNKKMLKSPVEKLAITFEKNGNGAGTVKIEWELTSLSIPFKVKNKERNAN